MLKLGLPIDRRGADRDLCQHRLCFVQGQSGGGAPIFVKEFSLCLSGLGSSRNKGLFSTLAKGKKKGGGCWAHNFLVKF